MGINVFPAPSAGGGIKSVQRGLAGGAGNVTITAVDTSKSFVNIYGTASSGTVAASGTINAATGSNSAVTANLADGMQDLTGFKNVTGGGGYTGNSGGISGKAMANIPAANISLNSTNLTGGSNNLVAAVVQGFLANSTTLTVSGACRWEVVEFN